MKLSVCYSSIDENQAMQTPWDEVAIELQSAFLSERALNGDPVVQGLSAIVLSRLHQKKGALAKALAFANQAVDQLRPLNDRTEYYAALLQRGHVHLELGLLQELKIDLEQAEKAFSPNVLETCKALRYMAGETSFHINTELLLNTWPEKFSYWKRKSRSVSLGRLEKKVLRFLMVRPRTKREMIKDIYGSLLDYDVLENRFKNLLRRIRKKLPDSILFENGQYSVSDQKTIYQKCNLA